MHIERLGDRPSTPGAADHFTGRVRVDPQFQAPAPARASGASVTFEPGARTAWHTHPLGQHLIVTSGQGWVQRWGGPVEVVRPGDVEPPCGRSDAPGRPRTPCYGRVPPWFAGRRDDAPSARLDPHETKNGRTVREHPRGHHPVLDVSLEEAPR